MKVVLAEKPSVARDIASFLGARRRHDGYYEGGGYQVTWAFGHLVTLKEPDDYDPALKKWSLAPLPFVPARFELKLVDDKRARQQFAIIRRLFRTATELICATDAGREGELIFRYIVQMAGCRNKPVRRLWLSSLTPKAIQDAFGRLRPGEDYDTLYAAARCRSEADWIVGLNATRNFTVRFGKRGRLWSAGRVQTPVLAMIVRRDDEIRVFRPQAFWELMTRYRDTEFKYAGDRFDNEEAAQRVLRQVQGHELAIQNIEIKREQSLPPQLFDLTELQREMNRRYALSAAETLQAAQSLYERKLITYPRTDSRYLSSDVKKDVPAILRRLQSIKADEIAKLNLDDLSFTRRIVNDKKVGDHHAVIPTGSIPGQLPQPQQRVFDAVVTRMIAAFYPPCRKEVTRVEGAANEVPFVARGIRIVSPGWTALYPQKQGDRDPEAQPLPAFQRGEHGPHEPFIKPGETKPPKHYTENTLLGALETAGKLVDDESLREALKEKGLGTPATRAAIIETLIRRQYVQRTKKTLAATDLGRYLVALIQERNLKSPELTGEWEAKLKRIETGQAPPDRFMAEIVDYARSIIRSSDLSVIDEKQWGPCPRCGRPVIQGKRGFGCSGWRDGCQFVLWKTYKSHEFDTREIRQLVQHGILSEPVKTSDANQAVIYLTHTGEIMDLPAPSDQPQHAKPKSARVGRPKPKSGGSRATQPSADRPATALGTCPSCGADVVELPKSYGCSAWKAGCKFAIWKNIAGKRISRRTALALLRDGKSSILKGFRSKAGNKFDARLTLDGDHVRLDFDS